MFNKLRGMFGEGKGREDMKPDEPNQARTIKNPDLDTWIKESGEADEASGIVQEFVAGDVQSRPHLELIKGGKSEMATEPVVEKPDYRQRELEQNLSLAQAHLQEATAQLERATLELAAYKKAKDDVAKAA